MKSQSKKDMRLRIGNLILAISLSTVPTAITYGILGLHGLNICSSLNSNLIKSYSTPYGQFEIKELCDTSAWETTRSYILLIGCFITMPTWLWFYLSVKKKKE